MTDCPLGLECPKTPECVNDESCFNWTKAWDLYEIVIVGALPPIFVHNVPYDEYDEWHKPEYGFEQIRGWQDFIVWYAGKYLDFESWKNVSELFEYRQRRGYRTVFCRASQLEQLRKVRAELDEEYARCLEIAEDDSEENIPF